MRIAVDFDGTVVEHKYPSIGKERPFAVDTLRQLAADGHQLILWTVRHGELLDEAVEWCRKRGVTFYAVNSNRPVGSQIEWRSNTSPKVLADVFIDDSNLGGIPGWPEIYQMISGKAREKGVRRRRRGWLRRIMGK